MTESYYCYILKNDSERDNRRTYVGFTNDPSRRIKQHNGIIKGGAKYTTAFGDHKWTIYALVTGFPDKVNALQCEWRIKHPHNKKQISAVDGRIKGLNDVLKLSQWTNNSTIDNNTLDLKVWIIKDYSHLLTDLPSNIELVIVDDIDLNNL
jgi:predicted GIY-YIG superfamily endonuclease